VLVELGTIVRPETLLARHRRLIAQKSSPEREILSPVDHSHTARAQPVQDPPLINKLALVFVFDFRAPKNRDTKTGARLLTGGLEGSCA
jgi:hypothetical protein